MSQRRGLFKRITDPSVERWKELRAFAVENMHNEGFLIGTVTSSGGKDIENRWFL
jgi:hypothetical protein